MAVPKTTEEILADPEAFKAAHARAREAFLKVEGVEGVGYGLKEVAGQFGRQGAIIVFVREKKPAEALAPAQRIPPTFEGYATDVRVVPARRLFGCNNNEQYKTIQGGIQIANEGTTTQNPDGSKTISLSLGTAACIVRRRNDPRRENLYILSNAHVMYAQGHGARDNLYHPEPGKETLGPIQDGGAEHDISWTDVRTNTTVNIFVDCAIARLDVDSTCCGSTCTQDKTDHFESVIDIVTVTPTGDGMGAAVHETNRITDVRNVFDDAAFAVAHTPVFKVGRSTGRTEGFVTSVNTTYNKVDRDHPATILYTGHLVIEIAFDPAKRNSCQTVDFFADEGDSGSLVVDAEGRAVGLLFGGALPTDPPGTSCVAAHIVPVLDHLGICIPCKPGATGRGSSTATDGTGVAPAALPAAHSTLPVGQIVFMADGAATVADPQALPTAVAPVPVNEEEVRRMHAHLAEFRKTRIGPPLHEVFREVRKEVGYLVRNVRPVKVAWARHHGPAWFAHVLNHIAGHTPAIPHEVQGVTRRALLLKMREVLSIHGSNPLRRALAVHGDAVLEMLTFAGSDGVADIIEWIRERESSDQPLAVLE